MITRTDATDNITTAELIRRAMDRSPWNYAADIVAAAESLTNNILMATVRSTGWTTATDATREEGLRNMILNIDQVTPEYTDAADELARAYCLAVMTASRRNDA